MSDSSSKQALIEPEEEVDERRGIVVERLVAREMLGEGGPDLGVV